MKMETRTHEQALLDPQLALGVYLQALLRPVAAAEARSNGPAGETEVDPKPVTEQHSSITVSSVERGPAACEAPKAVSPDWAREPFQCLRFRVAGLNLALPLVGLTGPAGVLPWDDAVVTPVPGPQPWLLGLREHLGRRVRLIDVAQVVLPADRRAALAVAGGDRLSKVIVIDAGGDDGWGLACDAVGEVITLSPDAVQWRTRAGSRPWLAGTVIKEMCALIDMGALVDLVAGRDPTGS